MHYCYSVLLICAGRIFIVVMPSDTLQSDSINAEKVELRAILALALPTVILQTAGIALCKAADLALPYFTGV